MKVVAVILQPKILAAWGWCAASFRRFYEPLEFPAVLLVLVVALCHRSASGSFVSVVVLKWLEGWRRERGEGGAGTPSHPAASSTSAALFIHVLPPKAAAAAAAGSGAKGVWRWDGGFTVGEGLRRLPLTHFEILAARDSTTAAAVMELQKGKPAGSDWDQQQEDRETQRHLVLVLVLLLVLLLVLVMILVRI